MLKVNDKTINQMEEQHPGIKEQIFGFENAELPPCPLCGSEDTADVQVGIIGRTIYIASATSKFTLIPNGPKPGSYRCNSCKKYFGEDQDDGEISGFTLSLKNGVKAEEILDVIDNIQGQWAKKYPERAHRLYPTVFDENGDRIQSSGRKAKRKRKPTSMGSTSARIKVTLSDCDSHTRKIFEILINGWKEAGGTVLCAKPGRIYLKLKTKAHSQGRGAHWPRNFNLIALASPLRERGAHIKVTWGLGQADKPYAYLDCIPKTVKQFERMVASLPGFEQKDTIARAVSLDEQFHTVWLPRGKTEPGTPITRLMINKQFKLLHAKILMDGMKAVKDAESKANNEDKKISGKQQADNVYAGQLMAQFGETPESAEEWSRKKDKK